MQVTTTRPTQRELYESALAAIEALKPQGIGCTNDPANDSWAALEFYLAAFPPNARIAELELQLAALQLAEALLRFVRREWTPISPENLPKVGDEVYAPPREQLDKHSVMDVTVVMAVCNDSVEDWNHEGWTHRRPIDAPGKEPL